jgi:hypothetical protein
LCFFRETASKSASCPRSLNFEQIEFEKQLFGPLFFLCSFACSGFFHIVVFTASFEGRASDFAQMAQKLAARGLRFFGVLA